MARTASPTLPCSNGAGRARCRSVPGRTRSIMNCAAMADASAGPSRASTIASIRLRGATPPVHVARSWSTV